MLLGQQQVVLAGLRLLFEHEDGFTVVAEGGAAPTGADVVVIDIDGRSNDLLTVLSPNLPRGTRIMMLGSVLDGETLALAFRHGVTGAVLKKDPPEVLLEAVRHVADGEVWLDRKATARLVDGLRDLPSATSPEAKRAQSITKREREVLTLVSQGLRNQQIANRLHISEVTVRNHLTSIFRKLKVTSRFQLAVYAFRHGLSKLPPKLHVARVSARASDVRRKKSAS